MIRKIISICLCLAVLLATFSAAADGFSNVNITYDRKSGTVKIDGKATFKENASEPVRLLVLRPGSDINKLISGEDTFMAVGVHADETLCTKNEFSFEKFVIPTTSETGGYIVRIATEDTLYNGVIPVATAEQAIKLINNASAEELAEYIQLYNDVYGLDTGEGSIFAEFDGEGKEYVMKKLANREYSDVEAFNKEFTKYTAIYKVKIGPWGTLEGVIIPNANLLGLNLTGYNALSASEKDKVFKKLTGNLFDSDAEFSAAFDKSVENTTDSTGVSSSGTGGGSKKGSSSWSAPISGTDVVAANLFGDLQGYDWARDSIERLCAKGVLQGKSSGIFAPGDLLTRAEAAKIIVLAFFGESDNAECDFSDVSKTSWSYPYIAAAYAQGILNGYDDGRAGASDNITREDFCVMILRAARKSGILTENKATTELFDDDNDISPYAAESVEILRAAGVVNGMGDNKFMPKENVSRAQAAKIVGGLCID